MPFGPFPKQALDEAKVATAKADIRRAVTHIADYFLQDKPFILGDKVSVADLIGLMELEQLGAVNEQSVYEENAKVKAWANKVKQSLQPHYDEAMEKIRGIGQTWANTKPWTTFNFFTRVAYNVQCVRTILHDTVGACLCIWQFQLYSTV